MSDLLTMLSDGTLTPPAIVRYSFKDFQEAVRLADGEAGQQKVLLDFSERSVESHDTLLESRVSRSSAPGLSPKNLNPVSSNSKSTI